MFSALRAVSHIPGSFFFIDRSGVFAILLIYMARIHALQRKSSLALRQRKAFLLTQLKIASDSLRASVVERFAPCGKAACHCHHGGPKHGPYYFLTQCLAVGKIDKFQLKTPAQQQAAQAGVGHYRQLLEQLEELSQINAQLLRRGEALADE